MAGDKSLSPLSSSKVSVIIIARNELCIKYTLESLKLQTHRPHEVIVIVDSPSDVSAKIAQQYITELPMKVVINNIKPGYGGARRKGCEVAQGDVIAFVDADAIVPPWWIAKVVSNLQENPVLAGPAVSVRETEIERLLKKLTILSEPQQCNKSYVSFAPTMNFAFKREVLMTVGNFDENFDIGGEDYDFCLRLRKAGLRILWNRCVYVFHIKRKSSLRRAWRDGRARARVFLKHGMYVIRDAITCFLHGFTILSVPVIMAFIAMDALYAIPLIMLFAISLSHRLYRAYLMWRKRKYSLLKAIVESMKTYVSYVAFFMETLYKMFSILSMRQSKIIKV